MMKVKVIQQNVWYGKYNHKLKEYLDTNPADILNFQEVTGGEYTFQQRSNRIDVFSELSEILGDNYQGFLVKSLTLKGDSDSYLGNAVFVRKTSDIEVKGDEVFWMNPYQEAEKVFSNVDHEIIINNPYSAILVNLTISSKDLIVACGHFSWSITPEDRDYKIARAQKLLDYLDAKNKPIILAGDFNSEIETKTVQMFDKIGVNLTKKYGITNTLNPELHRAKHIFPRGVACDYIFVPEQFTVTNFELLKNGASDHYGLLAEVEI